MYCGCFSITIIIQILSVHLTQKSKANEGAACLRRSNTEL